MGESGYKDYFMLDLLSRQARWFASIEEGASGAGSFLLLIGDHRLMVSVHAEEEAVRIRLPGAKGASEAARESLSGQLDESKDLILYLDDDGRVIRRRRTTAAAEWSRAVVRAMILIILSLLIAGGAVTYWIWVSAPW